MQSATTKQAKGIKSKVKHVLHLDKKEEAIRKEKEEKELEEDQRLRRDDAPGQHPVAGAGTQRKSAEQREKVPHSDKEMRDLSYEERCEKGAGMFCLCLGPGGPTDMSVISYSEKRCVCCLTGVNMGPGCERWLYLCEMYSSFIAMLYLFWCLPR